LAFGFDWLIVEGHIYIQVVYFGKEIVYHLAHVFCFAYDRPKAVKLLRARANG
jgi:hypothetical protein